MSNSNCSANARHKEVGTPASGILNLSTGEKPYLLDEKEWGRVPDIQRRFPLGKTKIYELLGEGKIRSCIIRKRGCIRGARLISVSSVRAFLESIAEGGIAVHTEEFQQVQQ